MKLIGLSARFWIGFHKQQKRSNSMHLIDTLIFLQGLPGPTGATGDRGAPGPAVSGLILMLMLLLT